MTLTQDLEQEYATYIMQNNGGRIICNGDMLIEAMESGFLWDEFLTSLEDK